MATSIHPTAIIDPDAQLGEDVTIGPYAVVESDTVIGDRCRLAAGAIVRRYTTMGADNVVDSYTVLGGEPQDYGFDPSMRSYLKIGDRNVFREYCTMNRGTGVEAETVIGNDNMFMTCAHAGHNVRVGNHCIMINGSALGGYAELGDGAILSAHVVIHQFCWVGPKVMSRGNSASSQHVPPFCMLGKVNMVNGLNRIGLRRDPNIAADDARQVGDAYRLLYRSNLSTTDALAEMDRQDNWGPAATQFRDFVRRVVEAEPPYNRGLAAANPKIRR